MPPQTGGAWKFRPLLAQCWEGSRFLAAKELDMLVLSRKVDERIMIGAHIEVVVCEVRGDRVRLGIKAPRHVAVHREEVYQLIQREQRDAHIGHPGG